MDAIKESMIKAEDDGDYSGMPLLEQLNALASDLAPGPDEIVLNAVGEICRLQVFLARVRDQLVSIEEYWNGNHNDMALKDAAIVMRERARVGISMIDSNMSGS